jgi:hypothetical protein
MKAAVPVNIGRKRKQAPAAIGKCEGAHSKAVKKRKLCSRCKGRFASLSRHQPFCKGFEPLTELQVLSFPLKIALFFRPTSALPQAF